jgi:RNA polymerase sigma-70 factor (ECF subfamily)
MDDRVANVQLDQLTAEMAWIRRLAMALVKDASAADDVAQDTFIAAAGHVPDDRPLRPWLSRVVLNVVRMRGRSAKRREAREAATAVPDSVPTATELIDRVELQRMVAGEVLALAEPYRSTVLLHYFEGLSSAEIARRLDLPDGTVRRRLKVALDELRARLAKRDEKRSWLAVLAPLVHAPSSSVQLAGGLTMKKLLLGFVALALLIGGLWLWKGRGADDADPPGGTAGGGGSTVALANGKRPDFTSQADPTTLPWLIQRGAPARRIAGHVMFRGKPVVGAIVRLGNAFTDRPPTRAQNRISHELATTKSGPDGAFDFGEQAPASFVVSAESEGKTPASVSIITADPTARADQIMLELGGCSSRLFGSVVDSSGGGVGKARLRVAGLGGADASTSGEYSLCVPMGDSRVRIEADGYGAVDVPIHLVGELRHDFELVPESVLVGTVVDETRKPVPYARVTAVPQAIEQPHFLGDGAAMADAEGRFRITNLAPGRFLLAAAAEGFGSNTPKAALASPGSGNEIVLVVAARAKVSGRVLMNGQPVQGAHVNFQLKNLIARGAYSQPDGKFVLENVPFGKARFGAEPYEVTGIRDLLIDKPEIEGLIIEVAELAALRGRVLRHGKPVADATIQTSLGLSATSDAAGAYEIKGLAGDEIKVTAQAFGATNAFSPLVTVKLATGRITEHDIDLTGGAEVHGVVVDQAGKPVPNVYVRLIDGRGDLGESMTNSVGAFQCTSMLGGGEYRVSVFPSPGARTAFALAGGKDTVSLTNGDVVLEDIKVAIEHAPMSISGRVVDDKGVAVADVHVEAIGHGQNPSPLFPSIRADGNGQFTIGNLAKGSYMLHAHAGDGSEAEVMNVAAGSTGIEIKLVRPGSIEGELVGFTIPPRVTARQVTQGLVLGNEAVIEDDAFSISGLVPGKYVLEALAGEENAGQSVEVKSGAVTRVKLESKGKGKVVGLVFEFGTRVPIAGMNCVAAQSMGGQSGQITPGPASAGNTTDAKGAFSIPAPVGKARVMCFSQDGTYSVAGGDVDVAAATPGKIELPAVKVLPPPSDVGYRIKPLTLPLVIASVDATGPAKPSGLLPGDRVMTIDGASLTGLLPSSAMMLAWNHRPGSVLTLGIERGGVPMTFKIVVAKPTN